MNRLFLLIPAVTEQDAAEDVAYLKVLGNVDKDSLIGFFRKINQSQRLVEEEAVDYYYDDNHLKALISTAQKALAGVDDMPQWENLLVFFDGKKSIQNEKIGLSPIKVYGVEVKKGLLNAFVENGTTFDALLNKDALNDTVHPLDVETANGGRFAVKVLECDPKEVYKWLVHNRDPKRKIDPNANKHKRKSSYGKGGKVSPVTYSREQLDDFLQKAVVAKKGLRELYFKDLGNHKIIIFWDENWTDNYHAFEIEDDDQEEIQKIYKRGGRALCRRIEDTSIL